MDASRWQHIEELYHAAWSCELGPVYPRYDPTTNRVAFPCFGQMGSLFTS
jgi:hypothetical protein